MIYHVYLRKVVSPDLDQPDYEIIRLNLADDYFHPAGADLFMQDYYFPATICRNATFTNEYDILVGCIRIYFASADFPEWTASLDELEQTPYTALETLSYLLYCSLIAVDDSGLQAV